MSSDIYWTHACLNALKRMDYIAYDHHRININSVERCAMLDNIKIKLERGDEHVNEILSHYSCPFVIHVT